MPSMRSLARPLGAIALACSAAATAIAQEPGFERLPTHVLDVAPPSARVRGEPGSMAIRPQPCRTVPLAHVRRRIVDAAVQEWAFFGFRILDRMQVAAEDARAEDDAGRDGANGPGARRPRRSPLPPAEAARVTTSIAGYWAVTPEGGWIVGRQNEAWRGPDGIAARWNAPWSAAFISWVMCEAGLGGAGQFQRAIAHHTYIDQAIRARDGRAPQAAFTAYDIGEVEIVPGDLLCSSRRPAYRTLADRRRQLGVGARSHCDVVVQVEGSRVLAIGGNVRGAVSLKLLPPIAIAPRPHQAAGARPMFAHLKLRAPAVEGDALLASPALRALGCGADPRTAARLAAATIRHSPVGTRC